MITMIVFAIGMTAMALIVDGDADFYETKKRYPAFFVFDRHLYAWFVPYLENVMRILKKEPWMSSNNILLILRFDTGVLGISSK